MSGEVSTKILIKMGGSLLEKGEFQKALEHFYKAYEIDPKDKQILFSLCKCNLALGNGREALAKAKELCRLSPTSADILKAIKSNNPDLQKFASKHGEEIKYSETICYLVKALFLMKRDDKAARLLPLLDREMILQITDYCVDHNLVSSKQEIDNYLASENNSSELDLLNAVNSTSHFLKTSESIEALVGAFKQIRETSNQNSSSSKAVVISNTFTNPPEENAESNYKLAKLQIYNNSISPIIIKLLKKTLKENPNHSKARSDLAIELMIEGGFDFNFSNIIDLEGQANTSSDSNRAASSSNNSYIAQAISYFETFTLEEELDFKISLSIRLAQKLEYEASKYVIEQIDIEKLFAAREKRDSSNLSRLAKIAQIYLMIGRKGKAKIIAKKALELDASYNYAQIAMARCLIRERSYDEANSIIDSLSDNAEGSYYVKLLKFVCLSLNTSSSESKSIAEKTYNNLTSIEQRLAREFLNEEKEYQSQLECKIDIAASNYHEICTILQEADAKLKQSMESDAEEVLRKGQRNNPNSYKLLAALCDFLLKKKKHKQALKYSEKMVRCHFPNAAPHIYYAASLFDRKKCQDAYGAFNVAISLYESNAYRYGLLIDHHKEYDKNPNEYLRLSDIILKKNNNDIVVLLNLRNIYIEKGDRSNELIIARNLEQIRHEDAEFIMDFSKRLEYLLDALKKQNNWSEIVKVATRILESDPSSIIAIDHLLDAHKALGHDDLAQEVLDKAIGYYPNETKYKHIRIQNFLSQGNLSEIALWVEALPTENQKLEYEVIIDNLYKSCAYRVVSDLCYKNLSNAGRGVELSKIAKEKILYSLYREAINQDSAETSKGAATSGNQFRSKNIALPTIEDLILGIQMSKVIFEERQDLLNKMPLEELLEHVDSLHEDFVEGDFADKSPNTYNLITYSEYIFTKIADIRVEAICDNLSAGEKSTILDIYSEIKNKNYIFLVSALHTHLESSEHIDWDFALWVSKKNMDYIADNPDALLLQAVAYRKLGKPDLGVKICNDAMSKSATYNSDFLYEKGVSLYYSKSYREAYNTFEEYIRIDHKSYKASLYYVLALLADGNTSSAYKYLTETDLETRNQILEDVAEELFAEEKHPELLNLCEKFEEEVKDNIKIQKYRCSSLMAQLRFKEAIELISSLLLCTEGEVDLMVDLSYAYYKEKDLEAAKNQIQVLLDKHSDYKACIVMLRSHISAYKLYQDEESKEFISAAVFDVLYTDIKAYVEEENYKKAIEIIDEMKRNDFICKELCMYEAITRHKDGNLDLAIELFEASYKNYPSDNNVLESLYKFYLGAKMYNERCYELLKMLERKTDFKEDAMTKALICVSNAKYNEAMSQMDDLPTEWRVLGLLSFVKQDNILSCEKRLGCLDMLFSIDPTNSTALIEKGMLLIKNQNYNEAIDFLKKEINRNPENVEMLKLIVIAYNRHNDFYSSSCVQRKLLDLSRGGDDYEKERAEYIFLLFVTGDFEKIKEVCSEMSKIDLVELLDKILDRNSSNPDLKKNISNVEEYILTLDEMSFERNLKVGRMFLNAKSPNYTPSKSAIYLKKAIALKPSDIAAYEDLSMLYLDNRQYEELINFLSGLNGEFIRDTQSYNRLQVAKFMKHTSGGIIDQTRIKNMGVGSLFCLGSHLLKEKPSEKIIEIADELISRRSPDGYRLRARYFKMIGSYQEAISYYKRYFPLAIKNGHSEKLMDSVRAELIEVCAYAKKESLVRKYLSDIRSSDAREFIEFRSYYIMGDEDMLKNTSLYREAKETSWGFVDDIVDMTSNNILLEQAKKQLENC